MQARIRIDVSGKAVELQKIAHTVLRGELAERAARAAGLPERHIGAAEEPQDMRVEIAERPAILDDMAALLERAAEARHDDRDIEIRVRGSVPHLARPHDEGVVEERAAVGVFDGLELL